VKPFICTMPMRLDQGWNQIQFNLSDFCRRAYNTGYVETLRIQLHCSCRVRRVYFSDRLYAEDELPAEFKLFVPLQVKQAAQAQEERMRAQSEEQEREEEYAAAGEIAGDELGDAVDYAPEDDAQAA
jgi:hypothetical protein